VAPCGGRNICTLPYEGRSAAADTGDRAIPHVGRNIGRRDGYPAALGDLDRGRADSAADVEDVLSGRQVRELERLLGRFAPTGCFLKSASRR